MSSGGTLTQSTINNRQFSILNVHQKTHKPIIIALKIWKKSC